MCPTNPPAQVPPSPVPPGPRLPMSSMKDSQSYFVYNVVTNLAKKNKS